MAKKPKDPTQIEEAISQHLSKLATLDPQSNEAAAIVKSIKTLTEAMPKNDKPWWQEHLGAIITTAGSLIAVGGMLAAEVLGDRYLRSKSMQFAPKPHL